MPLDVRNALVSFDDLRAFARQWVPSAAKVLVAYSARHEHAAVIGALDDEGHDLDISSEMMQRMSSLLHRHVPMDALVMAYPEADFSTGSIVLSVPIDEPEWARVTHQVAEFIDVGIPVDDAMIRDALWLALGSAHVPNGAIRMSFADEPAVLYEFQDGSGNRMSWADAQTQFAVPMWSQAVERMSAELSSRIRRRAHLTVVGEEDDEDTRTSEGPLIAL